MENEKTNGLTLEEFIPESELIVAEHLRTRAKFDVFDAHTHFGHVLMGEDYASRYDTPKEVEKLKEYGIKWVINLDGSFGEKLDAMLSKTKGFEDFFLTFCTVDVKEIGHPGFEAKTRAAIKEAKEKGVKGIKFLKDLSLAIKDSNGKFIPPDDKRLSVIWETAAEEKLPVLIHIADPTAFFKPIDRFNERYEELNAHPNWSFYGGGRFTFEQLMRMQENLLANNPNTTFILAHVGSYSENLAQVGKWLDTYPNMYVDIAERISELGRQPYTSKAFFGRWQDRILFGSDGGATSAGYANWPIYYRFLETCDEYFKYSTHRIPNQGRWHIYGIGLADEILEKVYNLNARKLLGI